MMHGMRSQRRWERAVTRIISLVVLSLIATSASAELLLSAPPREDLAAGVRTYGPISEYLSEVTGTKVVYEHPKSWNEYQKNLERDRYDLVFDGPHFVGWRMHKHEHVPLVALEGDFSFVLAVKKDSAWHKPSALINRPVCGHPPPNLATLTIFSEFKNPTRQPRLVPTQGFRAAYDRLLAGKCDGAILPAKAFAGFNRTAAARAIFESHAAPNQALTAGRRVPPEHKERIRAALLSEQGQNHARELLARFNARVLIPAASERYAGWDQVFDAYLGYKAGLERRNAHQARSGGGARGGASGAR